MIEISPWERNLVVRLNQLIWKFHLLILVTLVPYYLIIRFFEGGESGYLKTAIWSAIIVYLLLLSMLILLITIIVDSIMRSTQRTPVSDHFSSGFSKYGISLFAILVIILLQEFRWQLTFF